MRAKTFWAVFASVAVYLHAQAFQPLRNPLLLQPRHVVGIVVDSEGQPVPEAKIGHSNNPGNDPKTDSSGIFELDTHAPSLVVRKPGFKSGFVLTRDARNIRLTLRKVTEDRPFPTCSVDGSYHGIRELNAIFQFPQMPGVHVGRQIRDADYVQQSYYLTNKSRRNGIMHGSGPMWGSAFPLDIDIWKSVSYEEVTYDLGRIQIVDGSGQFANGNRWRSLARFGESATYSDVDEATARMLDKFLDGACVNWRSAR